MSQYIPREKTLKIVEHKNWRGSSGTVWMIHDDHGEYDGPYASLLEASKSVEYFENWNKK